MDTAALDKFATILVGCTVVGAAVTVGAPPAGAGEALTAAGGLFAVLRGERATDAEHIRKELTKALKAEWQGWGEHSSHADAGRRANAVASFEEVIGHCAPLPAEVVGLKLDPDAIAARVLAKAESVMPTVYKDRGKGHAETHIPREFLRKLTVRAYAHLIAQPGYVDQMAPELWRGALTDLAATKANTEEIIRLLKDENAQLIRNNTRLTKAVADLAAQIASQAGPDEGEPVVMARAVAEVNRQLDETRVLLEALRSRGGIDTAHTSGISDAAIVELAGRIAIEIDNPEQAFHELESAVEIAIRVQAEGRHGSNLGDFVDEVLRRVADLSSRGDYDAAAAEIDEALEAEDAVHKARTLRLLDAGLEQDRLRRNAEAAAQRVLRMSETEAGGDFDFEALRLVRREWKDRGRDKGLLFDQEVSIELARTETIRAQNPDQLGTALNDLGISLQERGEREAGTGRLEKAVSAYRAALEERTRERVPLDWARTQMNLGNTLQTLGEREAGSERLEQAVAAYRAALEEWTRDRVPLDWATAQMNLGNALQRLGASEAGTERLEQAVAAYRAALEEWTRDRVPLDWAMTQMNLGTALATWGARESGTERLTQAVAAFRAALEEGTRDRVPLEWATTQMNLGNAQQALSAREEGTVRLEQAVAAFRAALEERTRDRVPLDWAILQFNMGGVEIAIFDKTGEAARLDAAEGYVRAAREVFEAAVATRYLEVADGRLAAIAARRIAPGEDG